jgi:hypothetical protein
VPLHILVFKHSTPWFTRGIFWWHKDYNTHSMRFTDIRNIAIYSLKRYLPLITSLNTAKSLIKFSCYMLQCSIKLLNCSLVRSEDSNPIKYFFLSEVDSSSWHTPTMLRCLYQLLFSPRLLSLGLFSQILQLATWTDWTMAEQDDARDGQLAP